MAGGYLPWRGYLPWPGLPTLARGYLPWPVGTPPWLGGLPTLAGMGYPPRCEQTENITFPYPSDAGGNEILRSRVPRILGRFQMGEVGGGKLISESCYLLFLGGGGGLWWPSLNRSFSESSILFQASLVSLLWTTGIDNLSSSLNTFFDVADTQWTLQRICQGELKYGWNSLLCSCKISSVWVLPKCTFTLNQRERNMTSLPNGFLGNVMCS